MTYYAYFDRTVPDPSPVIGWFNTEQENYQLPDFRNLLEVTPDQWAGRFPLPTHWAVNGGVLTPYDPPVPLPVQAQKLLEEKQALGIAVTSASLFAIDGVYALDGVSTAQIFQIGTFANSFGVFPSGGPMQPYPDIHSQIHMFTVPVFIAFLRAVAALISDMQTQAGIMSAGGTPSWPNQTAALD